ncbi:MAG: protein kinase [Gammaproteobacteria bacterium]|jgi:serine/threonine protein kinase|nr:protein kinase [Gammaproteobacteria bacterium]
MTTNPNPTTLPRSGSRRANALPSGCMLDEYRIDAILGAGGFGVTYKALDTHLQNWVAIKEYFPVEWSFRDPNGVTVHPNTQGQASNNEGQPSDYVWGLERFLDEARVLARVQHPFVVRIKRYFRAHGTAYIVMDFEEGAPLSAILQDGETLGEDEVRGLLEDVLPALQAVHDQGFLHRDIKPSNLYVRSSDHRVILIDFGAAREAIGRHSKSVTSLVTPGYSPPEQYTTRNDRYGTWTDIYALGAVLYRCIAGHTPAEAAERLLDDTLEPAIKVGAGRYSANLLHSIDRALAVRPEHRFTTVAEMWAALTDTPDEDSDDTVIMMPLHKPGKTAVPPVPLQLERFDQAATTQVGEHEPGDWLEKTGLPTADRQTVKPRHSVLQSPSDKNASRRRLLGVLAGSGILAALAATAIWLWPSVPGNSPPPVELTTQVSPAATTPAATTPAATTPAATTPAAITPAAITPAAEPAATTPPPAVTEPVATTPLEPAAEPAVTIPPPVTEPVATTPPSPLDPQAETPLLAPTPIQEAPAGIPEEPAQPPIAAPAPPPAGIENADALPIPLPTPQPAPQLQTESTSKKSGKTAEGKPSSRTRQRAERRRRNKPVIESAPPPVQARPTPASPKRPGYWDTPTDSGFNNK